MTWAWLSIALLGLVLAARAVAGTEPQFLRVMLPPAPADLLVDLERERVWLGDSCRESLPIARLERSNGLHIELREQSEADPGARLPAAQFHMVLELRGDRGTARIVVSLAPAPVEVPVRVRVLDRPPCR